VVLVPSVARKAEWALKYTREIADPAFATGTPETDRALLKNLIVRPDAPAEDGAARFAVVAGGRRLAALKALAEGGTLDADAPVPCRMAARESAAALSTAENVTHLPMHPADQVGAFAELVRAGATVAAVAARFGVSERLVEQRLRLGNAAPELLDAYRAGTIDLDTLKAFALTTDHARQRAAFAQCSAHGGRPTAWQARRLLTEARVPAGAAVARFVGVEAYEAAGGAVLRDLFADAYESGVWLEDAALLNDLALGKLTAAAAELATRWKWAEARLEADWSATARYGRIRPEPSAPTDAESAELERLRARHDAFCTLDEENWTDALIEEGGAVEARIAAIESAIDARATFRAEDYAMAGCIATIGRDGALEVIEGLVKPEDLPKAKAGDSNARGRGAEAGDLPAPDAGGRVDAPATTTPGAAPPDPRAEARAAAGVGIGLADDLRAIRTALVKAHLAGDFAAAFDLVVFQMVRSIFAGGYSPAWHALDIAFNATADRPSARANDDGFAAWSPGEALLADWSDLPFEWMEGNDDAACFAALRALPRADKERLFAAAVARTVKGQLAFEPGARPELEATVARLGIDFAGCVRPTAALLWSRLTKGRLLDIARAPFGAAWAAARSKYKKPDIAAAMEAAFAAGPTPVGLGRAEHAAALAWTPPGFAAFDGGGASAGPPDGSGDAAQVPAAEDRPRTSSGGERIESPAAALAAAKSNGNGASHGTRAPGDAEAPDGFADGNGHAAPGRPEGEAGPEPVNGRGGGEDRPAEPSIADAIDAMNAVPTADGGPRVVVRSVGPVHGTGAGTAAPDLPAFLRRVH